MAAFLVTGGAGFIGSHLVDALVASGARVRVVDNLSTGHRRNLAHLANVEFVLGDLAEFDVARRAVEGMEYVLHQAAVPSVPRSVAEPLRVHRANVEATLNVFVAARDARVRRVVYAGSSSVYGDSPSLPKHEDLPPRPLSPYALQKLIGEQYARLFFELYGLETVTLRYFNVFGPRQDPTSPYSGVVSLFLRALAEGRRPTIYGDGEQTRDFTYVDNVVEAVLRACTRPGIAGAVINVAMGQAISVNQLLATLCKLWGRTVEPRYAEPRPGDVRHSQADISRARALLGYEPRVGFEEGLRRTILWYREASRSSSETYTPPSPGR